MVYKYRLQALARDSSQPVVEVAWMTETKRLFGKRKRAHISLSRPRCKTQALSSPCIRFQMERDGVGTGLAYQNNDLHRGLLGLDHCFLLDCLSHADAVFRLSDLLAPRKIQAKMGGFCESRILP